MTRYCPANRLNRLATLTYAGEGCHDPLQVRSDVAAFFRSLRSLLGGRALPYAWVPDWHKTDHGLHAHFAVGRFVPRSLIEQAWGRGHVHIKLLSGLAVGSTKRDEARNAAGYLAKYVGKTFHSDLGGLHRYEVAQGFQPAAVRFSGTSSGAVLEQACAVMGARPARSWSWRDTPEWEGPPAVWFAWA